MRTTARSRTIRPPSRSRIGARGRTSTTVPSRVVALRRGWIVRGDQRTRHASSAFWSLTGVR
jgi:hypothetical protein